MKLQNRYATIEVQALGAMLHDCVFHLPQGYDARPLYTAPWRSEAGEALKGLPPIIQALGSEWPCVPFGRPGGAMELPSDWSPADAVAWDDWAHGYSSNHDWSLRPTGEDTLVARIDYPANTPIQSLERRIRLLNDRPGISLSLTVVARAPTAFPLGLHPVLSMEGAAPGTLRLEVSEAARAWSFPVDVEPGRSFFSPNQQGCEIDALTDRTGATASLRNLPPSQANTEDLLLLTESGGSVGLANPVQKCRTTIKWNPAQLPGCAIWLSNGGRDYSPWNGRVAAVGIEPIIAPFDLGMAYAVSEDTPLARRGIPTALSVRPEQPFHCAYQILVDPI